MMCLAITIWLISGLTAWAYRVAREDQWTVRAVAEAVVMFVPCLILGPGSWFLTFAPIDWFS